MRFLTLVAMLLVSTPAPASQDGWIDRAVNSGRADHHRKPEVLAYRKVVAPRHRRPKPALVRHDDNGARCYPEVTVVGSQWIGEVGAQDSVRKNFMEIVRWRIGEAAMDINNARDVSMRCSRSSVGETLNQVFYRCELRAVPCRPGFEK